MDHIAEDYVINMNNIIMAEDSDPNKEPETVKKISDTIFSSINKCSHEEYQYLNLIENILENGTWEEGRNGKTKSLS